MGCFGHTLQLCLKPTMELTAVSKVVAKCRKLVGNFKHSTTVTAEMGVRQKAMAVPQHSLVQDVPTRWNSTYGMMARLVEQRRVLTDILLDTAFTKRADAALSLKVGLQDAARHDLGIGAGFATDTGVRVRLRWELPRINRRGHSLYNRVMLSEPRQELISTIKILSVILL